MTDQAGQRTGPQRPASVTQVVLDGLQLGGGSANRGIGRYLRNLAGAIDADDRSEVIVLAPPGVELDVPVARLPRSTKLRLDIEAHHLLLGRRARRTGADVLHAPGLPYPRRSPMPWVATVHDLFPLERPAEHRVEAGWWRRFGPAVQQADRVVAISRHTADQVMQRLSIPADRIDVIAPILSASFGPEGPAHVGDRPYVVIVGASDPRKRVEIAIEAMAEVARGGLDHDLHVIGQPAPRAGTPRDPPNVVRRGWVPDIAAAYRGASACLVTSWGEGFGYPALEAMRCGVPVVAIANTATSELVNDAGLLVHSDDPVELGQVLVGLLRDEGMRSELRAAGFRRSALFSTQAATDALVATYEAAAGR